MSFAIVVDTTGLEKAIGKLRPLAAFDGSELMTAIASLGDDQTRRRITEEKTSPDGEPWQPNLAGTPILVATGQHLLYSCAWTASASEAEWGATWEHAHVHQNGATIVPKNADRLAFSFGGKSVFAKKVTIPARPFVGLSAENERDMRDLVTDHLGELLQ